MSIFSSIKDKIFGKSPKEKANPGATSVPPQPSPRDSVNIPLSHPASPSPETQVDVGAVLSEMAAMKGGGGNYQTSIVDLLKLLDLDSSLGARKELAEELGVKVGDHGSPEQNIALHKSVMASLERNGGIVSDDLRN